MLRSRSANHPDTMADNKTTTIYEQLIAARFSPASSEADADLMLTTSGIAERIVEYNGTVLEKSEIIDMMNRMGYLCVPDQQLNFVWLLKNN